MASCSGGLVPGQVVLVLQGGGALGAYQVGVYQALHEAGLEPDWVIGTSIGAINGALIAGNREAERLARLDEFWTKVRLPPLLDAKISATLGGVPAFYAPRAIPWGGVYAPLGVYASSWYRTDPLQETLRNLLSPELFGRREPRLTVGAVGVTSGELAYFDSTKCQLGLEHVMASGALPPAFPAIRVEGEPYWDGGIYSNTPIEAVMDDQPRRDVTEIEAELGVRVRGVERGGRRAERGDGQQQLDDLRAVRQGEGHPVAAPHAPGRQAACQRLDPLGELGEGHRLAVLGHDQGRSVRLP